MSQAPTITQGSTSNSAMKKRRLEADSESQGDSGSRNAATVVESEEESSEGELTHQDVLERKRKKKANLKKQTEIRHRDEEIGKIAQSHPAPKASTPLARAIYEFAKMVMGIPRKTKSLLGSDDDLDPTLPDPPSEEEQQAWLSRKQGRENFIREAQEKAMEKYLAKKPDGFKPNRKQRQMIEGDAAETAMLQKPMRPVVFRSRIAAGGRSRFAHHFGTQCEAALAMAGFSRCTLDWEASWDTPWNSTTSSIILAHFVKAFDANGARQFGVLSSDNTAENREEVLRRWVGNKKQKFRNQARRIDAMKTPEGKQKVKEKAALQQAVARRRNKQLKLFEARVAMAEKLFGKQSSEVEMISYEDIHSEEEELTTSGDHFGTRQRKRLDWRSSELDSFISLLDQCHLSRQTLPKDKRMAKELTDRGSYGPEPAPDRCPPKGFQESLVSEGWIDMQQGLLISELNLNEENLVDIKQAISDVIDSIKSCGGRGSGASSSAMAT